MRVEFGDPNLERLEADGSFDRGMSGALVSSYRKRMQIIRAAFDERDLRALKSLRFEKLKGDRAGQHSLRLRDQWRLVVELKGKGDEKRIRVVEIVDYH